MCRQVLLLALVLNASLVCWAWSKVDEGNGLVPGKTLGAVWPQPQSITQQATYLTLDAQTFRFVYQGVACDLIDGALSRYEAIVFDPPRLSRLVQAAPPRRTRNLKGQLANLQVSMSGECETWPHLSMDESYQLAVDTAAVPGGAQLTAASVWGVLRGLETFSQLVYHDDSRNFYVNSTDIKDFPRFSFRGFLVDTSRHFVPVSTLKTHVDALAYNKFNVFHWHIVDDQSFPYQSQTFPEMSEKGAYNPKTHIYSFDDITSVIEYARQRGIRVVVEYDTPGHTQSWGLGVPGLLTPCYNGDVPDGTYGPINPILNSTYDFLYSFFSEVAHLFPDEYLHLGGDEVSFNCWASNPDVQQFMQDQSFSDYAQLESYYVGRLLDIVIEATIPEQKHAIVWQEVFDNGVQLDPDTMVNVWKDGYRAELSAVTGSGFAAILSSCWYLSSIHYGRDWTIYYECEPLDFNGTQQQHDLVVGGSACMWGEYVDATNLVSRTWPRASAVGERLWSDASVTNIISATPRLEEFRCKMLERGVDAEPPSGPNYCSVDNNVD